jgi:serine/threonine-protein kinase
MPFPESTFARTGRFTEIYRVGQGAAGQVYSALDNLGRRVAVKELLPGAEGFVAFRAKFEKEARLQAALDHPNIVRVHHLEEDPETRELYLICEYADGGSLADLLEQGPLAEGLALALALDICAALEETERRRIVHRDVKPSNILLFRGPGERLTAKLSDFGIAQDARQRKTTMLPGTSHPGTPVYMAPEQADVTLVVDTRADIFALGLTLWESLTGDDYKALVRSGVGPSLREHRPDVSAGAGAVITRAARPDREERYQTPRAMADDLRRILGGEALDARTVHLARPARRAEGPPAGWQQGLGAIGMTLLLMFASTLATGIIMFALGAFSPGGAQGPRSQPELAAPLTATPVPALQPTVPPPPGATATPSELIPLPTAPPPTVPPPTLDSTSIIATAVRGTAVAGEQAPTAEPEPSPIDARRP